MFHQKRRYLIVEENDVTTVLSVINRNQGIFSNKNKLVGYCGWAKDPMKWYVNFIASDAEWGLIVSDLSKLGEITVKVRLGGAANLYFTKNES